MCDLKSGDISTPALTPLMCIISFEEMHIFFLLSCTSRQAGALYVWQYGTRRPQWHVRRSDDALLPSAKRYRSIRSGFWTDSSDLLHFTFHSNASVSVCWCPVHFVRCSVLSFLSHRWFPPGLIFTAQRNTASGHRKNYRLLFLKKR